MKSGKLILKGKIKLLSPCHIGSGMNERTDMDLLKDSKGIPFIPATSLVGVLRHFTKGLNQPDLLRRFWGSDDRNDPCQGALYCKDLLPVTETKVLVRDGVAIDNKTGMAKKGAKFDFEIIERDTLFDLFMEVDLIKDYEDKFKRLLATIIEILKDQKVRLGAKTRAGLGRIALVEEEVYLFDFKDRSHILRWLKREFPEKTILPEPFKIERKGVFELSASFTLKNSLLIRSYSGRIDLPDSVHIESLGTPLIPGTSLKGAIRARAERIINTLGKSPEIIKDLFGYVDKEKKEARPSRVIINEILLPPYPSEIQTRIKIDRFTGGVMEGALLETKPLFSTNSVAKVTVSVAKVTVDELSFELSLFIEDCKDYEAGLMLLILKDLWTGDLPVGGEKSIGRGVFKGRCATIKYNGKEYQINEDLTVYPEELNHLVQSLKEVR